MKNSYRKKLEKASNFLREVFDDLETEGSDDFDTFGTRLEDLAGEIDDMLAVEQRIQQTARGIGAVPVAEQFWIMVVEPRGGQHQADGVLSIDLSVNRLVWMGLPSARCGFWVGRQCR